MFIIFAAVLTEDNVFSTASYHYRFISSGMQVSSADHFWKYDSSFDIHDLTLESWPTPSATNGI